MSILNPYNEEKLGGAFILLPLLCYVISQFSFAIGGHLTLIVPIISIGGCCSLLYYQTRSLKLVLYYLVLLFLCIFLATVIWDRSFDGTWYHADVQNAIAFNKWNPYYQWSLTDSEMLSGYKSFFWSTHYAKGIETISASWVLLTHNLESGKATNLIFLLGVVFLLLSLSDSFRIFRKKYIRLFYIIIIIGNPVFLTQLLTNYIDWTSYIFLVIILILLYKIALTQDTIFEVMIYMLIVLSVGVKINVAFWVCLYTLFFYWAFKYVFKFGYKLRLPINILISAAIGFVVAFNPYITNYLEKGNPFYPLAGNNAVDIMTEQIPQAIINDNLFIKIGKSLILPPGMGNLGDLANPRDIVNLIYSVGSYDARVGGFGLFFFYGTILLLVLSSFSICSKRYKCFIWGCILK